MTDDLKTKASGDPETSSHISIRPLYAPADLSGRDLERDLSYPGEYPFTRGVQATVYRGRPRTGENAGMGDAEESNKRYKYLLGQRHHGSLGRL